MPFELGLAVAIQVSRAQRHHWYVFEARRHRLNKSLSDLAGTDPAVAFLRSFVEARTLLPPAMAEA
jgi:hypothetical protein